MAEKVVRETGIWVDQSARASADLNGRATAAARQGWAGFHGWYDAAAVTAHARELAGLSSVAQDTVTGLMAEYVAHVTAAVRDETRIPVPKIRIRSVRNGVDPVIVHSRPAQTFKDTFAVTGDDELAIQRAIERGIRLIEDDLMLAARQAQRDTMEQLKVARYRRVLRPELSKSGPCGLCVVASNQIYHRRQLLPMHGRCECITVEVTGQTGGAGDPGHALNREDLDKIYEAAGSTAAADLKRTRVQVSQHGELGPVLHVHGQRFTGPGDLGGPVDPDVASRRLAKLQDVLGQLQKADKAGRDVTGQLAYQHQAIDRLQK